MTEFMDAAQCISSHASPEENKTKKNLLAVSRLYRQQQESGWKREMSGKTRRKKIDTHFEWLVRIPVPLKFLL